MDDLMMSLGAFIAAIGVGLVFLPAGLILFGVELAAGGFALARRGKKTT